MRPLRTKEGADDYRYFPEPDLPPLFIDAERRRRMRSALRELPFARRDRLVASYGLSSDEAAILTASRAVADWYETLARRIGDPALAARWTLGEGLHARKGQSDGDAAAPPVSPEGTAELLLRVKDGALSLPAAKTVWARMLASGEPAARIVEREGLAQVSDEATLASLVDDVIAGHPAAADQVRAGEDRVLGFLVGRAMARSRGAANPNRVSELLRQRLGREGEGGA